MEVGQGLPEDLRQGSAPAGTTVVPESRTVSQIASELTTGMTQELQERFGNAGLNSGVAQENNYRTMSACVNNITIADVTMRNSSEGSQTEGSTSFDFYSQSSAHIPKSFEVGTQVAVSRDVEISRKSRDEENCDEMYGDWCQPCRQKTGPCEDGHASCEVRKQSNERSPGLGKAGGGKTSIERQKLEDGVPSAGECEPDGCNKVTEEPTEPRILDERTNESEVLGEKTNVSETPSERTDDLQIQEKETVLLEQTCESQIPGEEMCGSLLSYEETQKSQLTKRMMCESRLLSNMTCNTQFSDDDTIDLDQFHEVHLDSQSPNKGEIHTKPPNEIVQELNYVGEVARESDCEGIRCEEEKETEEIGRRQDIGKAYTMEMVPNSQMAITMPVEVFSAQHREVSAPVMETETPPVKLASPKLGICGLPVEMPSPKMGLSVLPLEEASPKRGISVLPNEEASPKMGISVIHIEEASPKMGFSVPPMEVPAPESGFSIPFNRLPEPGFTSSEAQQVAATRGLAISAAALGFSVPVQFIPGSTATEVKQGDGSVTSSSSPDSVTSVGNTKPTNATVDVTTTTRMDADQHLHVSGSPVAKTGRFVAVPLNPPRNLFVTADSMISPIKKREFRKSSLWRSKNTALAAKPRALNMSLGGDLAKGSDIYDFDEKDEIDILPSNSGKWSHCRAKKKCIVEKQMSTIATVEVKLETDGIKMEEETSLAGVKNSEMKFEKGSTITSEEPEMKKMRGDGETEIVFKSNLRMFDENCKDNQLPITANQTSVSSSLHSLNSQITNQNSVLFDQKDQALPTPGCFPFSCGHSGPLTDFKKPMFYPYFNGRDFASHQMYLKCENESESKVTKACSSLIPMSLDRDSEKEMSSARGIRESDPSSIITQSFTPMTNYQSVLPQAGLLSNEVISSRSRQMGKMGSKNGAVGSAWPDNISGVCASNENTELKPNSNSSDDMSLGKNIRTSTGSSTGLHLASVDNNTGFPNAQVTADVQFHRSSGNMQQTAWMGRNVEAGARVLPTLGDSLQKQAVSTAKSCSVAATSAVQNSSLSNLMGEVLPSVQSSLSGDFHISNRSATSLFPIYSNSENARLQSSSFVKHDFLPAPRCSALESSTPQSVGAPERTIPNGVPASLNPEQHANTFQRETRSSIPASGFADSGKHPGPSELRRESDEEYKRRLRDNLLEEIPDCNCLAGASYDETSEGPYYTHLGAAGSVAEIRKMMEERLGLCGNALRIEKVIYTGKEGKSEQGCPIAKWIVRRSGPEEKALVLARPRKNHTCDKAVMIIAICIWEGLPEDHATELYEYLRHMLPKHGEPTERRCGANEGKTCACQGWLEDTGGASFSFGCSWSMYYNGCKFAKSISPRKFRLKNLEEEGILEHHLQTLATEVAPLYKKVAPDSYRNQTQFEDISSDCRLGYRPGRPWSGITAVVDFCTHAHKDLNNMNNGCTTVVTLTKHRGFEKPNEEQLHVLPLCVLDPTDEFGSTEGQIRKMRTGALESLVKYPMKMRIRSQPYICKKKQRLLRTQSLGGIARRGRGRGRKVTGLLSGGRTLYGGKNVPAALGAIWNGSRTGHTTAGRLLTRRVGAPRTNNRSTQKDAHVVEAMFERGLSQSTSSDGNGASQMGVNPVTNRQIPDAQCSTTLGNFVYPGHQGLLTPQPVLSIGQASLPSFSNLLPFKQMPGIAMHQSLMASKTRLPTGISQMYQRSTGNSANIGNSLLVQSIQSPMVLENTFPLLAVGFRQTTNPSTGEAGLSPHCTTQKLGAKKPRTKDKVGPGVLPKKTALEQNSLLKMGALGVPVTMNHSGTVQMVQQNASSNDWQPSQLGHTQVSQRNAPDWTPKALASQASHQQTGQDWQLSAQPTLVTHPQLGQAKALSPQVNCPQSGNGNLNDWQAKAVSTQVSRPQSVQGNVHGWQTKATSPQVSQMGYEHKWSKVPLDPWCKPTSEVQKTACEDLSSNQSAILNPFDDRFRVNSVQPSSQNLNLISSQNNIQNRFAVREPADGSLGRNTSHSADHQLFEPMFSDMRRSDGDKTRPASASLSSSRWEVPLNLARQEGPVDFSVPRGAVTPQGAVQDLSNSSYSRVATADVPGRSAKQVVSGHTDSLVSTPKLEDCRSFGGVMDRPLSAAPVYAHGMQQNSNRPQSAMSNPAHAPWEMSNDVNREQLKDASVQQLQPIGASENSTGISNSFPGNRNSNATRLYQPYNMTECLEQQQKQLHSSQLNFLTNAHQQRPSVAHQVPANSVMFQSPLNLLADASVMMEQNLRHQPESRTPGTSTPVEVNWERRPYTPTVTVNQNSGCASNQQTVSVGNDGRSGETLQQMTDFSDRSACSNVVSGREVYTENVENFRDGSIGGVAIALSHGSVLFEVAKRELHATTALKQPDRSAPTRISMVFYQHKNLNYPHHGYEYYQNRILERKQKKLEKEAEMGDATNGMEDAGDVECLLPDFQPYYFVPESMVGGVHTMARCASAGPCHEWK